MTLLYDGSFEGFLSVVFAVFEYRYAQVDIVAQQRFAPSLFGGEETVYTDAGKATRVLTKVTALGGKEGSSMFLRAFLSEEQGIENHLLAVFREMLSAPDQKVLENFGHSSVLAVRKAAKSVSREVHRMKEFVRFEQVGELYFACIVPAFDVLPLIVSHFRARFSDQQWVLYADAHFGKTSATSDAYEKLWKTYFKHIGIAERKNAAYQMRNMPKRYWQFLPEVYGEK